MNDAVTTKELTVTATEGYQLAARLYFGPSPRMAILVSSGTGYPQGFYERMARFMAAKGAVVLTYDFRGIGQSAPETLKRSTIEYEHWGQRDMPAALEALKTAARGLPVFHTGHSIGGSFIGFMPNHADIRRHAFLSVGSGYWNHHLRHYNPVEMFFWFGFGPLHLLKHGYIKQGKLWTGTSLPPRVYKTWRRWCMVPTFFGKDLKAGKLHPHHYNEVTSPIRSWLFTDDPIATPRASETIRNTLPNAPYETVLKTPADYGRSKIGHDGALRKGMEPLWQEIVDWFEADLSITASTS